MHLLVSTLILQVNLHYQKNLLQFKYFQFFSDKGLIKINICAKFYFQITLVSELFQAEILVVFALPL